MSIVLRSEPKRGEYRVMIEKHGEFYRCIQYTNMSITAMIDIVDSIRKKYPSNEGYKVVSC